jgi:hypothetical protein
VAEVHLGDHWDTYSRSVHQDKPQHLNTINFYLGWFWYPPQSIGALKDIHLWFVLEEWVSYCLHVDVFLGMLRTWLSKFDNVVSPELMSAQAKCGLCQDCEDQFERSKF